MISRSIQRKIKKGIKNPRKATRYIHRKLRRSTQRYIQPLIYSNVECPVCGWKGKEFLPFGVKTRNNALCPKCGALERHRLFYLYLQEKIPTDKELRVLQFAPNEIIADLFKSYENVDYISADIDPTKAMRKEDITDISFSDESFDIIFASHVLEHVEEDIKAMREVYKKLKPDGFAILQVPIKDKFNGRKIDQTYEDPSITTPEGRKEHFGQSDHVRVYGRDYKDRLETDGFKVRVVDFAGKLGREKVERYALLPSGKTNNETNGWIYFCTK